MALDMFINMGKTIEGETRDKEQSKSKDIILSWSWGMNQSGTTHTGGGGGAGKASFRDLTFTKYVDNATNALMVALAKGSHIAECKLLVRKAGEGQQKYIQITMNEVLVTSVATGGSGGADRLTENITINFAKVNFEYFTQDSKGGTSAAKPFAWNIAENTQV